MAPAVTRLAVSAPGRICLFGEHQDYLGLPVIAAAVSLRIRIEGRRRNDREAHIALPDVGAQETFWLTQRLPYRHDRDYLRGAANVLRAEGMGWSAGFDAVVRGTIPINAGASSSSALVVAWIKFLALMSDQTVDLAPDAVARLAHRAEVTEFSEPGGMMDHVAAAHGGVSFIRFAPEVVREQLPTPRWSIVIGNSGEAKDTKSVLARSKLRVLALQDRLRGGDPSFSFESAAAAGAEPWARFLAPEERLLLEGTLRNHRLTLEARGLLSTPGADPARVGALLDEQQGILRDVLGVSTVKLDAMLAAATGAGAAGGKLNGSGGGGCVFALVPGDAAEVAAALRRAGGEPYVVAVEDGVRVDLLETSP